MWQEKKEVNQELVQQIWNSNANDLKERITEINCDGVIAEWLSKIIYQYGGQDRKYHNVDHLHSRLVHFQSIEHKLKDRTSFTLALYFQYFQYNSTIPSSECNQTCITVWNKFIKDIGIPENSELYCNVVNLLALEGNGSHITPEHMDPELYGTEDKHYFLDIDMACLGTDSDEYKKYMKTIREEYQFLSDEAYTSLRLKVLKSFLLIPNIYATKEFRDKYEEIARSNIVCEINNLLNDHHTLNDGIVV